MMPWATWRRSRTWTARGWSAKRRACYDHRDRLTTVTASGITGGPAAYTTSFSYNAIGNLMSKAGFTYAYPASGPTSVRPHAVTCTNWTGSSCGAGASYSYDALGNLTSGGGGTYTWSGENQPLTITKNGVSEGYLYNADNQRIKQSSGGVDTFYFGMGGEETGTTKRHAYTFNGQTIAERDVPASGPSTFRYLHGDHLGSVAAVSTSTATPTVTKQYFTAWGDARHGNLTATTERNYTGQRKDDTGLLFYNARYYDPRLSRFISPDTIVPGMASGKGGMGSVGVDDKTKSMLTVDFHETQFAKAVEEENAWTREKGFDFELRDEDRKEAKYQGGPRNPQALNRYAYVMNNPLRYTDPTGHVGMTTGPWRYGMGVTVIHLTSREARALWNILTGQVGTIVGILASRGITGVIEFLGAELGKIFASSIARAITAFITEVILGAIRTGAVVAAEILLVAGAMALADRISGSKGIDIAYGGMFITPVILPPTVERQQGYWYGNDKLCMAQTRKGDYQWYVCG
jgi:RHS repeat-associated protein